MDVVNECAALLSNYEVLNLLEDIQAGRSGYKTPTLQQQNLATICYETAKYLEKTPCKTQDSKVIEHFVKQLQPFNLTKAEKLQLLNHRPTTAVEIQLLVEESEERLTEEQTESLLRIIAESLPLSEDSDSEPMDQADS